MTMFQLIRTHALAALTFAIALATASAASAAPPKTGYARSGDLDLYYEIHGSGGTPVVLLHGSLCTIEVCFGQVIPALSAKRQVIAFEQQGHGRTRMLPNHPFTVTQMMKDTVAVLNRLGVQKADIVGYSTGAAVALELALTHPRRVSKLTLISGAYERRGVRKEIHELIPTLSVEMMKQTPWYEAYKKVAPKDTYAELVERVKTIDDSKTYPEKTIRALKAPVLLIVADSDMIYLDHTVKFFQLLGGDVAGDIVPQPKSQLAIIPGTTHAGIMLERSSMVASMIVPFLDEK
jgi:pimeloyl-ACP methyl ester carboxylesterase